LADNRRGIALDGVGHAQFQRGKQQQEFLAVILFLVGSGCRGHHDFVPVLR